MGNSYRPTYSNQAPRNSSALPRSPPATRRSDRCSRRACPVPPVAPRPSDARRTGTGRRGRCRRRACDRSPSATAPARSCRWSGCDDRCRGWMDCRIGCCSGCRRSRRTGSPASIGSDCSGRTRRRRSACRCAPGVPISTASRTACCPPTGVAFGSTRPLPLPEAVTPGMVRVADA